MCLTTPSSLLSLASSSVSGGFLLLLGALPGPGNTHSIPALLQLIHGCRLSQRTFLFLQVTHDLGFKEDTPAPFVGGEVVFGLGAFVLLRSLLWLLAACLCDGGELVVEGLV